MNIESGESSPLSLIDQIRNRYYHQTLKLKEETANKKKGPSSLTVDQKLGLTSPHYREISDLDEYVSEEAEWRPIQYFRHKEKEGKRIVRIASPFEDKPDVILKLPEKPKDPYLLSLISTWDEIQHIVMIDRESLELLYEMAVRYGSRQPMIIQGPQARSKTFLAWVFACILETPYARMTCSSGTRETYLLGSLMPSAKREGRYPIKDVLTNPMVMEAIELSEKALRDSKVGSKLTFREKSDIALFLSSVQILLKLDDADQKIIFDQEVEERLKEYLGVFQEGKIALSDNRLVTAYDIIAKQTGLQLVTETRYEFVDSDYIRVYEGGGVGILDEFNSIDDPGVQNSVLPTFETKTDYVYIHSQRQPSQAQRHEDFFSIITINPEVVGGGRRPLAAPTISRNLAVVLGPITEEYIENILNYFLTGNDPEIRIKGKLYKGREDVKTPYRALEKMPYRDLVIKAISELHTTITNWVESRPPTIGQAKREGGFYIFDQRKITAVLDLMLEYYNQRFTESEGKLNQPDSEADWLTIVKSALATVYEAGIRGEINNPKSDRGKVHMLIEGLPIWDKLRLSSGAKSPNLLEVNTSKGKGLRPKW